MREDVVRKPVEDGIAQDDLVTFYAGQSVIEERV
jgi:hypothetical protein